MALLLALGLLAARLCSEAITTVAGNGSAAYTGDGGLALSASLNSPLAVLPDGSGGLYIADTGNHVIRHVTTAGAITTVAGTGTAGYAGDGGPAAAASLNAPSALALGPGGVLYIADTGNHCIRSISGSNITTVAGTGVSGFGGDGVPASTAPLNQPHGLRVSAGGMVYVADSGNYRIRAFSPGGSIATVAGNGLQGTPSLENAALSQPLNFNWGLAFSLFGNLRFTENDNHAVLTLHLTDGKLYHAVGSGLQGFQNGHSYATRFNGPRGLAVAQDGYLYIADFSNHRIRFFRNVANSSLGNSFTAVGTGTAGFSGDGGLALDAQLDGPSDVALDGAGNLFIADTGNHRIRKVDWPPFRAPLDDFLRDESSMNSFPNPFRPGFQPTLTFQFPSAKTAELTVLDRAGLKVWGITLPESQAGRGFYDWDGRDASGAYLPSGLYVASLLSDKGRRRSKFTVLQARP